MKKHIEAEKGELIIVSDEGHRAIIPAKDRKYFLDSLNGCDDCINKYIQQLPMMSNYAEDGSLVPDDGDPIKKETYEQWGDRIRKMSPNLDYTKDGDYNYRGAYEAGLEPVEVDNNGVKEYHLGSRNPKTGEILKYRSHPAFNQAISEDVKMGYVPYEKDGRIYTVDRKSKEYKDLYDSGKLLGYDRVNDLYIAPDLGGATIKATKPQWMKDKEALEKEYSKDWYIDNNLPKFSRSMGVSADNMHSNNVKQYNEFINNKLAEKLLKRNPNFEKEYESHLNSGRIDYLSSQFSPKELAIIKDSSSKNKISPSFWSSLEQNLLSIGNVNPVIKLKNSNLTNEEAQKEDTPFGLLERTGELGANAVRSVFDKDYTVKQFLSGKQSDATTAEKIAFDVLNLVGAGAWGKLSKTAKLAKLEEGYQAIKDGNNLVSKLSKADKVIDATKAGSKVLNETDNIIKPIISSVDDVSKQVPKQPWQMQEMPGLHLKSTMSDGAVAKIIEPKTGLVNVEQALAIIGKESGGADKVALIKQGLGYNIPKKMDYNDFRKTVQDQLIPLERQFSEQASNYGVGRLGYPSPKRSSYEKAIEHNEYMIEHYKKQIAAGSDNSSLKGDLQNAINRLENSKKELATLPLENQTLILGNKGKFGRGSNAHGNPDETLGHIHFLRDAETPDVLTVTQIQSDAFQGTHRIMPKTFNKEQELRGLSMMEDKLKARELDYSKAKKLPNGDYKFDDGLVMDKTLYEQGLTVQREMNAMKKAEIENFTQKQLLDKNHQERYLQELVDYAGKRGDVNKVRVPTSETAAKVQGYSKNTATGMDEMGLPTDLGYSKEHQTILKKYSEQPKTIKKLFGEEPKIVTDSKGNTWYEFDIPKKFKEGKGEIKAFQVIPPAIGSALYLQSQNKNKSEQ